MSSGLSSLEFLNTFIRSHPQLPLSREQWYVRQFRFAYDTKNQLLKEKVRVRKEIAASPPGLNALRLQKELHEIESLLEQDPEIKKIPRYRNTLIASFQ